MRRIVSWALAAAVAAFMAPAAHAQLFRAYLASWGSDAAACTLQAPCRLLPAALGAVAAGGDIWILDSANFNVATVEIAKSVTIVALPAEKASLVSTGGGPAVRIAAPSVDVTLRNLSIGDNATDHGTTGIEMSAGASLTLERVLVSGVRSTGLYVHDTSSYVHVVDSTIRGAAGVAILVENGPTLNVVGSDLTGNGGGGVLAQSLAHGQSTAVQVSDSLISGASTALADGAVGVKAWCGYSDSSVTAQVARSVIFNTAYGVDSEGAGPCRIEIGSTMLVGNRWNLRQAGTGVIATLGSNHIDDAEQANVGSTTPLAPR